MPQTTFEEVYANAYIRESVEVIICNTVARYPMAENCADDFRQQLWIAVHHAVRLFNPERGSLETYMRRVLDRRIRTILRDFFACRTVSNRASVSIELMMEHNDFSGLAVDSVTRLELTMDVQTVVSSLSEELREICRAILDGEKWGTLATRKQCSYGGFFRRFILPLRAAFAKENLQNYLRA